MKINQKGFAALEALLIVVIVAIIAGTGYYIYHANKNTSSTYNAASKSAASNPTSQANGGKGGKSGPDTGPAKTEAFLIYQWKIDAVIPTPPEQAALIQYKITSNGQQTYANFTTQELIDLDKQCTADNAPAGTVFQAKGTDPFYNSDGTTSGQTVQQAIASGQYTPYKQVGNYYYWYQPSPTPCDTTTQGQQLQQLAMQEVKQIVTNLKSQ